jgi:hypothetical protein
MRPLTNSQKRKPDVWRHVSLVTEELATWQEDREDWRALKVRFPDYIATYAREQTSYFGPDGLLRPEPLPKKLSE